MNSHEQLPLFPKISWVLLFVVIWMVFGLVPFAIVAIGNHSFSVVNSECASVAGTIGDAFGLANSFFAAAALVFVIWSIRLQQQEVQFARSEWMQNTKSQNEQVTMMREAADLTAINHIYNHYSDDYGADDPTGILAAVAKGHRRWAIRASFSSIDKTFETDRHSQVQREMDQLSELLEEPNFDSQYLCQVSTGVSSLLVDTRADAHFRKALWPMYELIRSDPIRLSNQEDPFTTAFKNRAHEVVEAWNLYRGQGRASLRPTRGKIG